MKTLREEILEYSGILTENEKVSETKLQLEKQIRRAVDSGREVNKNMLKRISERLNVRVVGDKALEKKGIPHFRVDMDLYEKYDGEKRFIFFYSGNKNETN